MKYLYTDKPGEGCHEVNGVYGRPVHSHQVTKLLRAGWKANPADLPKAKESKKEAKKDSATMRKELALSLNVAITDDNGDPLHYKLIDSAIEKAQANEHNES